MALASKRYVDRLVRRGPEHPPRLAQPTHGHFQSLFNLVYVTATSYRIEMRRSNTTDPETMTVRIAGLTWTDFALDNLTQSGPIRTGWAISGTIADNTKQCVYLKCHHQGMDEFPYAYGDATLVAADSFPDTTDTEYENTEVIPLWYIPWETDHIDIDNILDLREAIRSGYIQGGALKYALARAGGVTGSFYDNNGNQVDVVNGIIVDLIHGD